MREIKPLSIKLMEPGTRGFEDFGVRVFVSPPYQGDGWHLSFSCPHSLVTEQQIERTIHRLVLNKILPSNLSWQKPERGLVNTNVIHYRQQIS